MAPSLETHVTLAHRRAIADKSGKILVAHRNCWKWNGAAPVVCRGRNARKLRTSSPSFDAVGRLLVSVLERIAQGIGIGQRVRDVARQVLDADRDDAHDGKAETHDGGGQNDP